MSSNTYVTWSMTLYALYKAYLKSRESLHLEHITTVIDQTRAGLIQAIDEIEQTSESTNTKILKSILESLPKDRASVGSIVNGYDSIKDQCIGNIASSDMRGGITIQGLMELIEEKYIKKNKIDNPSPKDFKVLDLGGRDQSALLDGLPYSKSASWSRLTNDLYILTGGASTSRIQAAQTLCSACVTKTFVALDPHFESIFTIVSPVRHHKLNAGQLSNSLIIATGSTDTHFGYIREKNTSVVLACNMIGQSPVVEHLYPERAVWCHGILHKDIPRIVTESIEQMFSVPSRYLGTVDTVILGGNALFAFDAKAIREHGIEIPHTCVELSDKFLKKLIGDKTQQIWESTSYDTFSWSLKQITYDMGVEMVKTMRYRVPRGSQEVGGPIPELEPPTLLRRATGNQADERTRTTDRSSLCRFMFFTGDAPSPSNHLCQVWKGVNAAINVGIGIKSIMTLPRDCPKEMDTEELKVVLDHLHICMNVGYPMFLQ
jgi:hypothetical protein